jgi:protein SCO1/2
MRFAKILLPVLATFSLILAQLSLVHAEDRSLYYGGREVEGVSERHEGHEGHGGHDHSMHMKMMQQQDYSVNPKTYSIPDVTLLDANGNEVSMAKLLSADRPVALNFIFTTCTTICPVMTATFAKMQRELDREQLDRLQVISISIDPEYDRPEVLRSYAKLFNADESWLFLTGRSEDINAVMRAFDAYAGSKMNHQPLSFLRKTPQQPWLRVEGLASGKSLANLVDQNLFD